MVSSESRSPLITWWQRLTFRLFGLLAASSLVAAWAAARLPGTSPWWVGGLVAAGSIGLGWALLRPLARLQQAAAQMLNSPDATAVAWPEFQGDIGSLAQTFQHVLTQSRQQHQHSQDMLARLEAVLHHAQVGVAFSRMSHLELVSRHYCTLFRCEPAEVIGKPTRIMYPDDAAYQALSARARPAFLAHGAFEGELELVRRDGERFWAHMRGRAVIPGNLAAGTIWIIEDVTQAREQRERLTWSATHDTLTQLANRHAFESLLGQALASGQPFCALFIDLDRFKQVNDTGGHAAGDALLSGLAQALRAGVRGSDTVARLGGDEFAVLLPGCPPHRALAVAEKLRGIVEQYALPWEGRRHTVGASIGMVDVQDQFRTPAEVLRAADAACYAAKRGGRNQVATFNTPGGKAQGRPDGPSYDTQPAPIEEAESAERAR